MVVQWYLRLLQDREGFVARAADRWRDLRAHELKDGRLEALLCK
jgi:hypothetical protein